jgi:hypothetical protein
MVSEALRHGARSFVSGLRIWGLWLVPLLVMGQATDRYSSLLPEPGVTDSLTPEQAQALTVILFCYLGSLVLTSGFHVSWLRQVLLGETPPALGMRLGRRVLRYALVMMGLLAGTALVSALIQLLGALPPLAISPGSAAAPAWAGLSILAGLFLLLRLSLVFPALAADRPDVTLIRSWQLTAGNTLSMALGFLVILLPYVLALIVLGGVLIQAQEAELPPVIGYAIDGAGFLLMMLCLMTMLSFLAFVFQFLAGRAAPELTKM